MVKISKSKTGQFRVTINPQIASLFNLDPEKEYEWVSVQGFPALIEKKWHRNSRRTCSLPPWASGWASWCASSGCRSKSKLLNHAPSFHLMCPGSYSPSISLWVHPNDVVKMKDSKGKKISMGDRVKVLWSFDNNIHFGDVFRITGNIVEIDIYSRNISIRDHRKITKIPDTKRL